MCNSSLKQIILKIKSNARVNKKPNMKVGKFISLPTNRTNVVTNSEVTDITNGINTFIINWVCGSTGSIFITLIVFFSIDM